MTKKKNVLQKFGSFYNRLLDEERKQLIDLFSAWRGPDSQDESIKTRTSAKVRAAILKYTDTKFRLGDSSDKYYIDTYDIFNRPCSCEVNKKPLSHSDIYLGDSHFSTHISVAYEHLRKMGELP